MAGAIAAQVRSHNSPRIKKARYDRPTPGRTCASCAICGTFFWYYKTRSQPVIYTCDTACANTFRRTSTLITKARAMGDNQRFPQSYFIWNRTGTAPPRIAYYRLQRALRRARRRRQKRMRERLKALLKKRTITAADLAYIREENFDILLSAVRIMSDIFTREQTEAIRNRLARMVTSNLDRAQAFLSGTDDPATQSPVNWTPTHVGLFGRILNKVVPDLSMSHNHIVTENVSPDTLTLEQLAAIAAGADKTITLTPTKAITHDLEPRSEPHPLNGDPEGPGPSDPGPRPPVDPA